MPSPTPTRIAYLLKMFPRLSETFILNELRGLGRLGFEFDIYSLNRPSDAKTHPGVAELQNPVFYLPSLAPAWRFSDIRKLIDAHIRLLMALPGRYFRALAFFLAPKNGAPRLKEFLQAGALAHQLRKRCITHVHAHFANIPTTVAELAGLLCGVTYSFTAHAKDIYLSRPQDLKRKIAGASFVMTCTGFNQKHLLNLQAQEAGDPTPIHLCYHGIDLDQFQPPRAKPTCDPPLILSVGRFCEKKGFPDLIHACYLLRESGQRFTCRIIGYGEKEKELGDLIAGYGLRDCVSLVGPMTQDQLAAEYARASVFVLPCLVTDSGDRDGIPNVLLEAMSMGVPVVSTDVSGISEVISHARTGLLVPEKNAGAVADALSLLLEQPQLGVTMAAAARENVLRTFSIQSGALRVIEAFQSRTAKNCETVATATAMGARS